MSAEVLTKPAVSTAIRDDHPTPSRMRNRIGSPPGEQIVKTSPVRFPALVLVVAVTGCGGNGDRPSEVVSRFLEAEGSPACQYLTAPQAERCRRPAVPERRAEAVVIESVRVDGDRAIIRASYDWTGYRRRTAFTLVRRDGDWLIVKRPTVIVGES